MVMLPTLLFIGAPSKLVLWGERVGIECLMSQGDSHARDSQTRQVAAIFRTLHLQDEGFFVFIPAFTPYIYMVRVGS